MSLQDRLNREREKQLNVPATGTNLSERPSDNALYELQKQNEMLKDRMLEIEKSQETRNNKIDLLIEKLEKGTREWNYKIDTATEKVANDLVSTQSQAFLNIKTQLAEQKTMSFKFYQIKAYSLLTVHVIAMILLIALVARTLLLGVWEGLFLEQLWNLEGWYWNVLTIFIILGVIAGTYFLIIKGVEKIRY